MRAVVNFLCASIVGLGGPGPICAQVARVDNDPQQISVAYPRVRLVHSYDSSKKGTTGDIRSRDPFLLYELGRDLVRAQFSAQEGARGRPGVSVPSSRPGIYGPVTLRDHSTSCAFCHTIPTGELGSGQTIPSVGPAGRNTPHLFGAGLIEHIGQRILLETLDSVDRNGDGIVEKGETIGAGRLRIRPTDVAAPVDYGSVELNADGVPGLNSVFRVYYVDPNGEVLPEAKSMNDPRVFGMRITPQLFGWGHGYSPDKRHHPLGGEATTLRRFVTIAADVHMGLEAFDPALEAGRGFPGIAHHRLPASLSGAFQSDMEKSPDTGAQRTTFGWSCDDPDGDFVQTELSDGDLDAIEFFLLHYPPPVVLSSESSVRGRALFDRIGCAGCHVPDWAIPAADLAAGTSGDRRLFRLETSASLSAAGTPQFRARLVPQSIRRGGEVRPSGKALQISGVFSDFRHWDIGQNFWETRYDGSIQKAHRTAPLWGVGSSAPYGHSGRYLRLDDVIRAHGGAARAASRAYKALSGAQTLDLLAFLQSLILWDVDTTPTSIDGNEEVDSDFEVRGHSVGIERFDARFLFANPPKFEILKRREVGGVSLPLMNATGVEKAFGLNLAFRQDKNADSFPDVVNQFGGPCAFAHVSPRSPTIETSEPIPDDSDVRERVRDLGAIRSASQLIREQPWLAYRLGQMYFSRQWSLQDGAYQALPSRPDAGTANSCALCHATPFGSAGFGANATEPLGAGRNAPHLYGVGLLESIGIQIQSQIMNAFDSNRNGWIDFPSESDGQHVRISPAPGVEIVLGSLEDFFRDGWPDLNSALMVTFVDASGRALNARPDGSPYSLLDPEVAGYTLEFGTFASTAGDHQFQSLRGFSVGVIKTVFGIPVDDRTTGNDSGRDGDKRAGDGFASPSSLGAPQHYLPPGGLDKQQSEAFARLEDTPGVRPISTGELDLLEWYLLNQPPPMDRASEDHEGKRLLRKFGCTQCHIEDWYFQANDDLAGDRRFFDVMFPNRGPDGIATPLPHPHDSTDFRFDEVAIVSHPAAVAVRGVYSDLLHHDLGEEFYEYSEFGDGLRVLRRSRTPPLWGVGSTAPYGRRGLSPTLDHVIRRHGGEAAVARGEYVDASEEERRAVLEYLESLTLFDASNLPAMAGGEDVIH